MLGMSVVFAALFVGFVAAVLAQLVAGALNLRGAAENGVVLGSFAVGMLASTPFIANIVIQNA